MHSSHHIPLLSCNATLASSKSSASPDSDSEVKLYFTIPEDRVSPSALDLEGPTPSELLRVQAMSWGRTSPADLSDGTVHVICSGPRGPRFARGHFCRGTVLCDPWRPRLTNSFGHFCNSGASRVTCSGPKRPRFTKKPLRLLILSRYCTVRSQLWAKKTTRSWAL